MSQSDSERSLKEFAKKHTSGVTAQVVEAYPNFADPTAKFIIDHLSISGDAAGTLQIVDDTGADVNGYFFTFGTGQNWNDSNIQRFLKKIPRNRGFGYTVVNGGNYAVLIKYHIGYDIPD